MRYNLTGSYRSLAGLAAVLLAATLMSGGIAGCASNAGVGGTNEPSDQALKDPMDYSPDIPNTDMNTGGNTLDTKSFDKDVNDLFNP
ncbi:MAG TPA: hypothetical protein VHY37_06780 [Tepidisphaeraceae bacterium]|jgi:hypothetical protein|nr:hypothetical protein [Tepidisphaeraceae bacterium]